MPRPTLEVADIFRGHGRSRALCDPNGDQFFSDFVATLDPNSPGSGKGRTTFLGGTDKFEGISGGHDYTLHGGEFKPPADLTYIQQGNFEGEYKIRE
jgi:hypothetical protein